MRVPWRNPVRPINDRHSRGTILQRGPPGDPSRTLSAEEAIKIANTSYSPADVQFMRDMIPHDHQALRNGRTGDRSDEPARS